MARNSYPLQWPDGWPRTDDRRRGFPQFKAGSFAKVRDELVNQLRLRGGVNIAITSDLPTKNNGMPYANGNCSDPGIAVWWVEKGRERVIACDRWISTGLNLRALEMSIKALRGLDRWGASEVVERAFAGFTSLPAGDPVITPFKRPWRDVLKVNDVLQGTPKAALLIAARINYRALIKTAHPDAGGTHELAAELNAAFAEAEAELTRE